MKPSLVTILVLFAFALPVNADNLGYSKTHPLIFGIDMDYPPMEYVDEKGIPQGFDVEFTQRLMKRLDMPFTYSPNTWENIADDILNGNVDLGMMVYSPYRKDDAYFSRAVFRLYYQMVCRKDESKMHGLRDVNGKTFALMRSRPIIDTLSKAGAKTVIVTDLKRTMIELSKGKYDAVICFRYQARYIIGNNHLENLVASDLSLIPREYCYVSLNKELIEAIDAELDKMDEDGLIDEVYGEVKTHFDEFRIPKWIWLLMFVLILAGLLSIIYLQRRSRKQILREMKRAQRSEELKDIFLSNLSHSLRTPLNAIIGFSDLLMSDNAGDMKEDEKQHVLGLINSNGLQLLHLINELLSLSDIEGKSQLFDRHVTDIDYEMATYAAETRMQLTNGVIMEVEEPFGGIRALIDGKLLRLVTMHLLDNARQNTKEGRIKLAYYVREDGFYVEVKDTGVGLPEKLRDNIFALLSDKNTYVQEDTPGLGLSICKAVIDKGGGKIGVRDNEEHGHGTVVWFWIPVKIIS